MDGRLVNRSRLIDTDEQHEVGVDPVDLQYSGIHLLQRPV
jgi:hypothetical protein